jgi:hypothetical protein
MTHHEQTNICIIRIGSHHVVNWEHSLKLLDLFERHAGSFECALDVVNAMVGEINSRV